MTGNTFARFSAYRKFFDHTYPILDKQSIIYFLIGLLLKTNQKTKEDNLPKNIGTIGEAA